MSLRPRGLGSCDQGQMLPAAEERAYSCHSLDQGISKNC